MFGTRPHKIVLAADLPESKSSQDIVELIKSNANQMALVLENAYLFVIGRNCVSKRLLPTGPAVGLILEAKFE